MCRAVLLLVVLTLGLMELKAQESVIVEVNPSETSKSKVFVNVEQKPEFQGGRKALTEFYKKTSSFPICDKKEDNCKNLYYQIIIDTLGNVGSFKIIKGINKKLDKETEQIVNQMPKWIPGKKGGKKVNVLVTLSVKYKLE